MTAMSADFKPKAARARAQTSESAIDSAAIDGLRARLPAGVRVLMIDNYD